jgi:hypothetical protein
MNTQDTTQATEPAATDDDEAPQYVAPSEEWPTEEHVEHFLLRTHPLHHQPPDQGKPSTPTLKIPVPWSKKSTPKAAAILADKEAPKPALHSSFPFQRSHGCSGSGEYAKFLQVPAVKGKEFNKVHLICHCLENVWHIPKPDVIITLTGGAKHFDLPPEHKDKIMRGMTEGTRHLNPWLLSLLSPSLENYR